MTTAHIARRNQTDACTGPRTDIPAPRPRTGTFTAIHHLAPLELEAREAPALPHRSTMHWPRKIFHMIGIGSVGLTLAFCNLPGLTALAIMAVIAVLVITPDVARFYIPALNKKVNEDFRFIMRDYEASSVSGITWFLSGMVLVLAMVPPVIAGLAALLLAFGDPWASVFGVKFGRTKLFGSRKSVEGMLGGFGVCLIVSLLYFGLSGLVAPAMVLPAALLAAAAGAGVEALTIKRLDDNFVIPVVSAPILAGIVALLA